jgi:hypothetical protein
MLKQLFHHTQENRWEFIILFYPLLLILYNQQDFLELLSLS